MSLPGGTGMAINEIRQQALCNESRRCDGNGRIGPAGRRHLNVLLARVVRSALPAFAVADSSASEEIGGLPLGGPQRLHLAGTDRGLVLRRVRSTA
jgi:hypothetical protein